MINHEEVFGPVKAMINSFCAKINHIVSLDESDQERVAAKEALRRDIAEALESLSRLEEQVLDELRVDHDRSHKMQIVNIRLSQVEDVYKQVFSITSRLARENIKAEVSHQKAFAYIRTQLTPMLEAVETL